MAPSGGGWTWTEGPRGRASRDNPGGVDPTPRISVVVPVYNRTSLLGQTVESVKGQTLDSWELIVVDDGSTEDVRGAMTPHLSDRRVSYRRQANGERCVARNNGAAAASGELLCFLDSDDRYASDALESLLAA